MSNLSIINEFPETKLQVQNFVDQAAEAILSGSYNPLAIEVKLKAMEEIIKALRSNKDIKDFALDAAADYDKSFEFAGAKFTKADTRKFDYSEDSKWNELSKKIKLNTELRKSRETLLKSLDEEVADPATGEIIKPATSTVSQSLRISLL